MLGVQSGARAITSSSVPCHSPKVGCDLKRPGGGVAPFRHRKDGRQPSTDLDFACIAGPLRAPSAGRPCGAAMLLSGCFRSHLTFDVWQGTLLQVFLFLLPRLCTPSAVGWGRCVLRAFRLWTARAFKPKGQPFALS